MTHLHLYKTWLLTAFKMKLIYCKMRDIDKDLVSWIFEVDMRQRPRWMKSKDDLILETLEYTDATLSISGLAFNTELHTSGVSESTLYRRLPDLIEAGLIKKIGPDQRFYRITKNGSSYLKGEFRPPDLDEDKD